MKHMYIAQNLYTSWSGYEYMKNNLTEDRAMISGSDLNFSKDVLHWISNSPAFLLQHFSWGYLDCRSDWIWLIRWTFFSCTRSNTAFCFCQHHLSKFTPSLCFKRRHICHKTTGDSQTRVLTFGWSWRLEIVFVDFPCNRPTRCWWRQAFHFFSCFLFSNTGW